MQNNAIVLTVTLIAFISFSFLLPPPGSDAYTFYY